jgi:hypothetical protein
MADDRLDYRACTQPSRRRALGKEGACPRPGPVSRRTQHPNARRPRCIGQSGPADRQRRTTQRHRPCSTELRAAGVFRVRLRRFKSVMPFANPDDIDVGATKFANIPNLPTVYVNLNETCRHCANRIVLGSLHPGEIMAFANLRIRR